MMLKLNLLHKIFKDFFTNKYDLPRKLALKKYVSPPKQNNRSSSKSPFRNQKFTPRQRSSPFDNRNRINQSFNGCSRSLTPNNRKVAFRNSLNPKYQWRSNTPPQQNSTNKF